MEVSVIKSWTVTFSQYKLCVDYPVHTFRTQRQLIHFKRLFSTPDTKIIGHFPFFCSHPWKLWRKSKKQWNYRYFRLVAIALDQLCPTRGPRAAWDPVNGFVRPSLGFRCSKSILRTDNLSLLWYPWSWHFWCRWSSVPLYHVCYHCS